MPTSTATDFQFVRLEEKEDRLRIHLTDYGRECLEDRVKSEGNDFLDRHQTLRELLEGHTERGWAWIEPWAITALTSAPILCPEAVWEDMEERGERPGAYVPASEDAPLYWHERYAIESPVRKMLDQGYVDFQKA